MKKLYGINERYVLMLAFIAAMGGFLFGYDWVLIGDAKPFYERFFHITDSPFFQGVAMSSALFGCIVGAGITGYLTDKYGRKIPLFLVTFLFIFTSIGTGAASSFSMFMTFRILGGIGIGIASGVSPVYIAEISPAHMRGKLVAFNQLTISMGVLSVQIMNMLIAQPVLIGATDDMIFSSWNG